MKNRFITLHLVTVLIGCVFSFYLFWTGFCMFMSAGSEQDCYSVYFSLWPTIFFVCIGAFSPKIGGILLICNAMSYAILFFIGTFYVSGLSVASVIDNVISYTQKKYFFESLLMVCGPMTILGGSFLFIGLKKVAN